jgi:hypothetical protein
LSNQAITPATARSRKKKSWEQATREAVIGRIGKVPAIRFFSSEEAALLGAVVDRVMPQNDRSEDRTIPILPILDDRLFKNSPNGFRYEDMPPDREAYQLAIPPRGSGVNSAEFGEVRRRSMSIE